MSESAPSARPELEAELDRLKSLLEGYFGKRRQALTEAKVFPTDTSEWIEFEHLTLEISDEPSSALVFQYKGKLYPHVYPRLELHLRESSGLQNTRSQLGRIARYTSARHLQEGYPVLSITTYARLAAAAKRLTPQMRPATATFLSNRNRLGGIDEQREAFDRRNNYQHKTTAVHSLAMPTSVFIDTYQDY